MNTAQISITMPEYVYQTLISFISKGKISSFISQAVEAKLLQESYAGNPVDEFIALSKKTPKQTQENIIQAIKKGRL